MFLWFLTLCYLWNVVFILCATHHTESLCCEHAVVVTFGVLYDVFIRCNFLFYLLYFEFCDLVI